MPEDFIRIFKDHFYIPLYFFTWLLSVFRYKRFFDTPLKYLPMLIMYTFFTELLGYFIKFSNEFQFFSDYRYTWHNVIIFNIYQLVFFLFFFEVYRKMLQKKSTKKLVSYFSILCVIIYLVNAIAYNPLHNQMTYAHIIGSLMMIYILIQYFFEKTREENPHLLKFNLLFWMSIGLLIFYTSFPLILVLSKIQVNIEIQSIFRPVLVSSILLMYGFIILGLLVGKRKAFR